MDAIAPQRTPVDRPALEGSLSDLEPVELLRLLAQTGQTGTLQVLADGPVLLTIVDGAVSYATDDPARTLRDVLAAEGLVDEITWERATEFGVDELGEALVHAGVPEEDVSRVVRQVVLDAVVDLSLGSQGKFRFVPGRRHSLGARFHYPPKDLDRDVRARLDEWESIRHLVPSFDHRARLAPSLPGGRTDVTLRSEDWRVMVALSQSNSLDDARAALGTTRFLLARGVALLVGAGVLELTPPDDKPNG